MDYRCWNEECDYYRKLNNLCVNPRGSIGCDDFIEKPLIAKEAHSSVPFNEVLCGLLIKWETRAKKLDPNMDTIKTVNKARDLGWAEAIRTCIEELKDYIEKAA